jgi:TPR repeat protein
MAAAQGLPEAQLQLGHLSLRKDAAGNSAATSASPPPSPGSPCSLRAAAGWYRMAAKQGLAPAQYNYAVVLLARGKVRARGATRAEAEESATAAGLAHAQAHAAKWFRKAAAQGHAAARRRLLAGAATLALGSEPADEQ